MGAASQGARYGSPKSGQHLLLGLALVLLVHWQPRGLWVRLDALGAPPRPLSGVRARFFASTTDPAREAARSR